MLFEIGDVVWAPLKSKDESCIQMGRRPAIVLHNNLIRHETVIIPMTTAHKKDLPTHIYVPARECALTRDSIALCENITSIESEILSIGLRLNVRESMPDVWNNIKKGVSIQISSQKIWNKQLFSPLLCENAYKWGDVISMTTSVDELRYGLVISNNWSNRTSSNLTIVSLKESTGVSKGNLQVYLSDENGNCKTCIVDDECESIYSVEKKSVLKTGYYLSNRDERKKMEQWISGFIPM